MAEMHSTIVIDFARPPRNYRIIRTPGESPMHVLKEHPKNPPGPTARIRAAAVLRRDGLPTGESRRFHGIFCNGSTREERGL